ncbi:GroES-like protein [Marasmius fiardii PR-910]|nr:GroES-like protein [Marasmius fiardii PR-910]
MLAICTLGDGSIQLQETERPSVSSTQVLVQVYAAAQNPTDWKTVMNYHKEGAIVGCDFAGVIVEFGEGVNPNGLDVGSRVAGFVHGGIQANGSFAEYVTTPQQTLIKIPDSWSFEQACQLGIACFTACQCLYQSLSLPLPFQSSSTTQNILVWGGSSSVGHYAIQLAKLSGFQVYSTASLAHFESVKDIGATAVLDYRNSKTGEKIHELSGGTLVAAVDCISEKTTPFQVSNSLSLGGGTIATTQPYTSRKKGVVTIHSLAYTALGHAFDFPESFTPDPVHIEFAEKFRQLITQLLAEDKIIPMPIKVLPHGLGSVLEGFENMRAGKVSREKIVYRISDTPGILRDA